ncbi:hypothetical protein [Shimia marina]|uniref:Uncharacterized protein n=1 Tax=Shimia marina TaxID=321267 RepID=A0A0P1ER50_9RHOB|nr:hypothetical protein [Shimia marina]CUH52731.1 hypothetical protein SHM7688_02178 [Shimia marina]SFE79686.1 hypothetical protein SAMN04488037_12219 [Shimia marina]
MTLTELLTHAQGLETQLRSSGANDRYELHQQLHRTLVKIEHQGGHVPARLKRLDLDLLDEEIEDSFDNMPV